MHFAQDLQTYSAAAGLPWTVVSSLAITAQKARRKIYAWVGTGKNASGPCQVSFTVALKNGGVEVGTLAVSNLSTVGGGIAANGWAGTPFGGTNRLDLSGAPAREAALHLTFNFQGGGTVYMTGVDLTPVEIPRLVADTAELRVTALTYPTIGASGDLLVCYLGVQSCDP